MKSNLKPRIITLGGMWSTPAHFEPRFFQPLQRRGFERRSALEFPYHKPGAPDPRLGRCGLRDYQAQVIPQINRMHAEDGEGSIFVGFSMGALLGMLMQASDQLVIPFRALVLLSPMAPLGTLRFQRKVTCAAVPLILRYGLSKKPFLPSKKTFCTVMVNQEEPAMQKRIFESLVYESGQALLEAIAWLNPARRKATRVNYKKIQVPTYVAVGEFDRVCHRKTGRLICKNIPGSTYRILKGRGHWMIGGKDVETTGQEIADWLIDKNF